MKIKRILLTGDDGYNSIGTRLLIRALKDKYDLQIAATKHQQSGVGGAMSLRKGGTWGEDVVDGVPVFWVDGTPTDVMECAQSYYAEPFDLIISGVNLGVNVTTAVISSGTFSAAVRGIGLQIAPRAIAFSWDVPGEFWHKQHDANEDISSYFDYPGDSLIPILDHAIEANLWDVPLLNINFPKQKSNKIRFTKIQKDITKFFIYPIDINREKHTFSYDRADKIFINAREHNLRYDAAAVAQGYISITPCTFDQTHFQTFEKFENTEFTLDFAEKSSKKKL